MPDLDVEQETGLLTPVEEPSPEMAAPTPAPVSTSTTGEVVRRLGETARMDHALSPPATTPASFLSRPAYAMAANAPQKARMVLDLQQRYGNAYTQQVMNLVQPMPAAPATMAPEDEAPSDAPAAPAEPAIPAAPAISTAPAMPTAPAAPSTPTQVPAPPPTPAVVKPEASPMPEVAKPEVPPIPAVAEVAPQPLVAAPLETEAPPPAEAVAVPPEAAMAPLAAEPERPAPEVDVSVEAEVAEEEAMAETPAVPEGETEASAEEAAAVEEAEAEAESTEEAAPEAAPAEGAAEGAAPAEGGAGAAAGDRAPASPEEDPAFQAVVKRSAGVAKEQRAHAPASDKAAAAQSAASGPSNEVASIAAGAQVGEMDAQEPQAFDRESFKAALLEKIAKTAPRNLKEADDFKDSGKLDAVKRDMTATVGEKKAQAQGNIAEATQAPPDTTGIEPKPVIPLESPDAGPPPADLGAAAAAPKPKTDSEISLQEDSDSLDQKMQENEITETQLENANEPAFQTAVDSKKTAQTDAQERPLAYRQEEQGMVAEAKTTAVGSAQTQLATMHTTRSSLLEQVATGQVDTKGQDELKRVEVANHIEAIYQRTKANVEARLARLDEDVNQAFDAGSAQAQQAFESHVEARMDAYKDERYSGLRGKGRWIRDKFKGLPSAVNVFYEEGRNLYLSVMDGVLNNIAIIVETGLNDAKAEIALGKQDVQIYVDSLPVDLQDVGQQAADKIQSQFDDLEQQVNDKQGELVDALAKKYHDNLQKLDARIEEMKAANRGLIDKALGAIVGVIKTILALKDMLLNVLARAAAVIGTIISDPIGFLGNLVSGVMMGLENFMANIGQHLKKGLMEWLFGALGEAGIEMPDSFDFKGILSLILQILGLTYANIRARAVNIVGEAVVKRLEQTVEIFKVLITEGPAGLWNMIQEQIGNLKDMVLDGIESFIKEKVLIAGITWIISLLNPASAFIKACKAIYDIVMFFVQRGSQILALVNAVLDSVTAIAQGALGAAAAAVENALAKAIPVAIAFLASLLGLGGISEKIRTIIEKVRAPVNRAIDWVINKAVQLVKAAGKLFGVGDEKKGAEEGEEAVETSEAAAHGPATRPTVQIPFTMSGVGHTLTFAPEEGGDVEVLMASRRSLPLRKEFAASHTALDNLRRYVDSIEEPAVSELFQDEFGNALGALPADLVQQYNHLYNQYFPRDREDDLSPKEEQRAKQQVQALIRDAEQLTERIRSWGDEYEIDGLQPKDIDETVQERGNRLWSRAWQETKQRVQDVIRQHSYQGVPVQMRGSVEKGFRGDPKARTRFDERDFDVDMFVVHEAEFDKAEHNGARVVAGKIFPQRAVPDLVVLSNQVRDDLVAAFPNVARIGQSNVVLRRQQPRG